MGSAADTYQDRWITCTPDEVRIRGYYFPWGTKRIPYSAIRGVQRAEMTALSGRGRIWGTSNPRYWASLDPARPGKTTALLLDLGRFVRPVLTPEEPEAALAVILARSGLPGAESLERGPLL